MYFLRGIFDRIVLVIGIVAAGCIPSFIAQYRQRVGGRLDQVLQDLAPFQVIANQFHHGSLQELIQYHLADPDSTFHSEGAAILAMVNSADQLRKALEALNTDLFHQLCLILITKIDPLFARATWDTFAPSFNLTAESVIFAVIRGHPNLVGFPGGLEHSFRLYKNTYGSVIPIVSRSPAACVILPQQKSSLSCFSVFSFLL